MNLPNALSLSRIAVAPIFFLFYMLPIWTGQGHAVSWIACLVIFILSEITDVADGMIARKLKQVSALGKVLDPLSDVLTHLTLFICLNQVGILHIGLVYVMLVRELLIILIRMVLLIEGVSLAAAMGGKIKSVLYACAGGIGLVATGGLWFKIQDQWQEYLYWASNALMALGVIVGIISFLQYAYRFMQRHKHQADS
jgi:CDP-diacylglycerol--glycerol-3-phosphate 3-phosphatidyltransferase